MCGQSCIIIFEITQIHKSSKIYVPVEVIKNNINLFYSCMVQELYCIGWTHQIVFSKNKF